MESEVENEQDSVCSGQCVKEVHLQSVFMVFHSKEALRKPSAVLVSSSLSLHKED